MSERRRGMLAEEHGGHSLSEAQNHDWFVAHVLDYDKNEFVITGQGCAFAGGAFVPQRRQFGLNYRLNSLVDRGPPNEPHYLAAVELKIEQKGSVCRSWRCLDVALFARTEADKAWQAFCALRHSQTGRQFAEPVATVSWPGRETVTTLLGQVLQLDGHQRVRIMGAVAGADLVPTVANEQQVRLLVVSEENLGLLGVLVTKVGWPHGSLECDDPEHAEQLRTVRILLL